MTSEDGRHAGKGYVHVNTGNGKGKTTAALGVALRTVLCGKRVYFAQFIKGADTSELLLPGYLEGFTIVQYGRGRFVGQQPDPQDIHAARRGFGICREILVSGAYDLVVLDEVNLAVHYDLLTIEEVIDALDHRAPHVEVICTGRYAHPNIVDYADLVTEMVMIKHYYGRGVRGRRGIEY
ncbi:cob(I)yrinic acid a,c-diamide adenosyltransferase [Methanomicrobiaceae archaeon CYW5]|uniref:cob(I)yrinic acid a,c-diamide adenosyltransferase n=1 Tax=Methanovulcanius yangii TaxID=1789227 RepID=UPI0029CA480F|nr:cob(I)yrinic acid a,c-diamide adenosyltransferase [Methanovulcanius yangii]MBT8507243.1 cob(I)yrinic acid a,c-diamide adenosyltransferase [Methanovulcanius yangii]